MAVQMEKPRDVIGVGLIMAIGAGCFFLGRELEFGTSFQMGPGYFLTVFSVILLLHGGTMVLLALRKPPEEGTLGHLP